MCGPMGLRGSHGTQVTHWVSEPWGHVALNVLIQNKNAEHFVNCANNELERVVCDEKS